MILFEHGPSGMPAVFRGAQRLIVADAPAAVPAALAAMADAQAGGAWLAGYASYEFGLALEPRLHALMPPKRACPLLMFGVFDGPQDGQGAMAQARREAECARLSPPEPLWDAARHAAAFARLADYIAAGDCYQVNLTLPMHARRSGTALGLFGALARVQPVRHAAFVDLGHGPVILSRSPELFFRLDAQRGIECRPMKGTIARGATPQADAAARTALLASEKDRAENLMIVDLLRNDIGRICDIGSVAVPDLFQIETYATLHQMVSRITGRLRPGIGIGAVLAALFPCGSITGAPKIRAMQIIAELEDVPRDVYCGTIGWAAPDGSAAFNVAIRTLSLFGDTDVVLNVGGGVVHDSTAAREYEEALWKARFALI